MSTDRDVDRIVRSWLEEGVTALPDRVLDNVLDRLPATHQRRSWWPARRLHEMNTPLRIALAAAAVLVVALLGITLLPRVGGVAAPVATPTPTPAVLPTGSLTAGTYVTTPFARIRRMHVAASVRLHRARGRQRPGQLHPLDPDRP